MHHVLKSLLPSLPFSSPGGSLATATATSLAVSPAAGHPGDDTPPAAEAAPCGCGWFDSSHELHQGLCVTEHSRPDIVANELGVAAWLDLHLAGWTSPPAVVLKH